MRTSRRTLLSFLGLAPTIAVGTESFGNPVERPGELDTPRSYTKQSMVAALRRLADGVASGQIDVMLLETQCRLSCDVIPVHDLRLRLTYRPEANS